MDYYKKKRSPARSDTVCMFCGQSIPVGERAWYVSGTVACRGCFEDFARAELSPYEFTVGEEEAE